MKNLHLKIDDSLILSRIQYKELMQIKPGIDFDAQFFPLVSTTSTKPFFDNSPLNIGFIFSTIGNQIIKVEVDRGYFYQDLEGELGARSFKDALLQVAQLNMASPLFYQLALIYAFDDLYDYTRPQSFRDQAECAMEIIRVHHHLTIVYQMLLSLGCKKLAHMIHVGLKEFARLEKIMNRIYIDALSPLAIPKIDEFLSLCSFVQQVCLDVQIYFLTEEAAQEKLAQKFIIPLPLALSMGLSGLYVRANRHDFDLRRQSNSSAFYNKAPKKCTTEGGDLLSRFNLRFLEIDASLVWLEQRIKNLHQGLQPIVVTNEDFKTSQKVFALGELEGPEGEIKINIFTSNDGSLLFKIRTPAYFIAQAIPYMARNSNMTDFGLLLSSLGITATEVDK